MKSQQSGSTRRPLAINDLFFEGLGDLIGEVRECTIRTAAEKYSLPLDKVRAVAAGRIKPVEPDYGAENFAEQLEEHTTLKRVLGDLERGADTTYSLTYTSGYNVKADSSKQIRDVLAKEPGRPDRLWISAGGYQGASFFLQLYRTLTHFEVSGDRREVDHLHRRVDALLRSSEPDHAWLHSRTASNLVNMLATMSMYFGLIVLLQKITPNEPLGTVALVGSMIASLLMGFIVTGQMERSFPRLQFEYGPDWRKLKARRTLLLTLVTGLFLPLVIGLLI